MGILNFLRKKKIVKVNLNSDDLTDYQKLQEALNEIAYLRGQEARRKAEEGKLRKQDKEKQEEEQKINELNKQEVELNKKDLNGFSLFKLLEYQKKAKNKVQFTTYDGKKTIGLVEDFLITADGGLAVVSGGKIVWASKDINHVFYSVGGLNNMAKNYMIPLCVNDKGQFQPNIMQEETTDVVMSTDGKFRINRISRKPFNELLADKDEEIGELQTELMADEEIIGEQQKEINEKERELNLHKTRADVIQSELSMALSKVNEIEMASGQIARQNTKLTQLKEINEDLIDTADKFVSKWNRKIEDSMSRGVRDLEWEDLKNKLNWAKQNMPQTIYVQPEKEKEPTLAEKVKPGVP